MSNATPGAVWIVPALLGFWVLTVVMRMCINRVQRRRRGWGDFWPGDDDG